MNTDKHGWAGKTTARLSLHLCSSVFICGFLQSLSVPRSILRSVPHCNLFSEGG
jgi:hypothetical protein